MPFLAESSILEIIKPPEATKAKCDICQLYKRCNSPKMPVAGEGRKRILVVGEGPGEYEDLKGVPFVGKTGKHLQKEMSEIGLNLFKDCWVTNAIICRPEKNRTPTRKEIGYCRPNLTKAIRKYKPDIIVPVGHAAVQAVLVGIWSEAIGKMNRWVGWKIPCREYNAWITPVYHPSFILRQVDEQKGGTAAPVIWYKNLKAIAKLRGKPYEKVPDLKEKIEVITNQDEAIKLLKMFTRKGGPIAFDYETNMLKPDDKKGQIYAASVCWRGKRTIAFPFGGTKLIKAWKGLLESDCPKIAQNLKMEDRWSRKIRCMQKLYNISVRNWCWDTMVQAHVIDNRPRICSLAFQALVVFGLSSYYDHISPFLAADRSYDINRITDIELSDLLLYNGFDSLITYMLAEHQSKILGVGFDETN